jgi:hypothetical protein
MKKFYLLIVFIAMFQLPKSVVATHFAGCDLTYQCLGGNDYLFTLSFYRDCTGIDVSPTYDLDFTSSCGIFTVNLPMLAGYPIEITPTCPNQITSCSGGTLYGVQLYVYQKQITLAPCSDWQISFSGSARNSSNNLVGQQNWYIPAFLNNLAAPCNTSPQFANLPVTVICQGQTFCYYNNAIDPDGDSLVYSFVAPLSGVSGGMPTPCNYQPPYTPTNPLPSALPVSIDSNTGQICMAPSSNFIAAIAVRVEEWRRINGIPTLICYVTRDLQINIVSCTNYLPTIAGINPAATQYNPNDITYAMVACLGDTIDFNVYPYDQDTTQNLTLTCYNGIPGATLTVTNNNTHNALGHFHWVPSLDSISFVPQCFMVNVKDNNCPYLGQKTFLYCISVTGITVNLGNDTCVTVPITLDAGNPGSQYLWSDGSTNQTLNVTNSGQYSVTVTEVSGLGCDAIDMINITCLPASIESYDDGSVKFDIFPNPANESMTLEFRELSNDDYYAEIYTIEGKSVQRITISQKKTAVDISSLFLGIYFVKISGNNGVAIKKMVKE